MCIVTQLLYSVIDLKRNIISYKKQWKYLISDQHLVVSVASRKSRLDHYWWHYGWFMILPLYSGCSEGPDEQPNMTILFEREQYHKDVHCFFNSWMNYCISWTRIVDDRRQPHLFTKSHLFRTDENIIFTLLWMRWLVASWSDRRGTYNVLQ